MRKLFLLCLVCLLLPVITLAATSDFTFKVLVGEDMTPPTTPTLLSVVPVSQNQIDVAWSVASDNYLMGGYVLLRDGVAIATSTLTSFIDTGLTAETLYEYTVFAFDAAGNVSTTSSALSTTTLAIPVVATSTPALSNTSDATRTLVLKAITLNPAENSTALSWQTSVAARFTLRWGRTDAYTGGYVTNEVYQTAHETTITDLEPGTTYLYELTGYTPSGTSVVLKKGQFSTLAIPEEKAVANITKLTAEVVDLDVILRYELPEGEDVALVRIVRSHLGFPLDSNDGAIVYEGVSLSWRDIAALSFYEMQYYTVFAISSNGTVSSGAVVGVRKNGAAAPIDPESSATTTASGTPPALPEIPLFGLEINAIKIIQLGAEFNFLTEKIALSYKDSFTISIPFTALPKHLKSIIVTLLDPTDQRKSYAFLLRINKNQTAYEATIAPLYLRGSSRVQVEIFDYEKLVVGRYRKPIVFVVLDKEIDQVVFPDALVMSFKNMIPTLSVGVFVLSLLAILLWRRSRKAEDNH